MALSNIGYDATAKSTVITLLTSKLYGALLGLPPVIVFTGAGRNSWFEISQQSNSVIAEIACDGNIVTHIAPSGSLLTGTITFNPSSPTLAQIANLASAQNTSGKVLYNTLVVENTSIGTLVQYDNFVIAKNFNGWSFSQQLDDYQFAFYATPPSYLDVASITNILGAI